MHKLILIIEDEVDIAKTIRYSLEGEGYDVVIAGRGEEGLEKAKQHKPDLVILDLRLPRLQGEEVCKEIRKDEQIAKTPIIMLTSKDAEADRIIGKVVGANVYMTKPFDLDKLSAKIKELVGPSEGLS
ncbi:MAG: response regulator [Candidatus Omnitrophica bacterium]|nr:response regulator [Candidatus Omnitrophota bacterium]